MFPFSSASPYPIGIDVGAHAVRILQFKTGAGGLALQAACRITLDSLAAPDRLAAAVRHALAAGSFAGRKVVLSLPTDDVHTKSVRLPQMPDADLAQALLWEAKDRFGFDIGDAAGQLAWFRAGEVRRGTEVKDELLLFAVKPDVLRAGIDALAAAKLQLAAVDLAPCAAFRAAQRAVPHAAAGTAAFLDLGHGGAQFYITRDGELVFYKCIDIGGRAVNEAVAGKLGITPAEANQMRIRLAADAAAGDPAEDPAPLRQALRDAMRGPLEELAREVDMCLRYYVITFRGARPDAVALIGRQATCPDVRDMLAAALGLAVDEPPILRGVGQLGDVARPDRSGEWAVAAGLSLYPLRPAAHARRPEAA